MHQGPFTQKPSFLKPDSLQRLIPIVYRHIRISEDLIHDSGDVYSPGTRDHAQQFRNSLISRLENSEDSTTMDALRDLADDSALLIIRDWILNILDKRLRKEADFEPWIPSDIREFAERNEVDPKNDRELFAIALRRLQVLKWDVEKSDTSSRDDLRQGDRELLLRRWLQRWLKERSQSRYVVPQEEEIDLQERPDLRLENPKFPGPVSIEVKWADNWSVPELLERLENQLVGQYLRAHNSRYGIYFLGHNGDKDHWMKPGTSNRLAFAEVVDLVRLKALSLLEQNPKVHGLEVVTIDFRQPVKG